MVDGQTVGARSPRRFYCRYAFSLTGGAIAVALLQQAVLGAAKDARGVYVYDSDRARDHAGWMVAPSTAATLDEPAAVIIGEDGRVLAVQQSSDSAAVIIEQVLDPVAGFGELTEKDEQPTLDDINARAEASVDLDALP